MDKKTEALKLALEALELATTPLAKDRQEVLRAQAAIREALAEQPAQQCRTDGRCQYAIDSGAEGMGHCPKGKCVMPAQQEPIWFWTHPTHGRLYKQPPAQPSKPWVGLTRAERFEIEKAMSKYYDYQHECKTVCLPEFARAIEAKLKEKNT